MADFVLTKENYHGLQANQSFMSWHQFQGFMACAAQQKDLCDGVREPEKLDAFLVGSYVHCSILEPHRIDAFRGEHKADIFKKNGEMYADFALADEMAKRLSSVRQIREMVEAANTEVIYTARLFGVDWRAQMDAVIVDNPKLGTWIIDIKTCRDFSPGNYDGVAGGRLPWYSQYGYWGQLAVYREILRINTGLVAKLALVGVTKQSPPDHQMVILADDNRLDLELERVRANIADVIGWKAGAIPAPACGLNSCAYCRENRGFNVVTVDVAGVAQ